VKFLGLLKIQGKGAKTMKRLIKNLLSSKNVPLYVALMIILIGLLIVYAINNAPLIAIIVTIFITLVIAALIFLIAYVSINDKVRLAPLFNQQFYVYEVLNSNLEWDILSADGSLAKLTKTRRIRFLESHISTLREYFWGDTYSTSNLPLLTDFKINPGAITKVYAEGGEYVLLITLDKTYKKNEQLDTFFERQIRNGFLGKNEWVEYVPVTNSRCETLHVNIPKTRPIKNPRAKFRRGDYLEEYSLGQFGFSQLDSEQTTTLTWVLNSPIPRTSYLIEWEW
jgi:hypothetical protein